MWENTEYLLFSLNVGKYGPEYGSNLSQLFILWFIKKTIRFENVVDTLTNRCYKKFQKSHKNGHGRILTVFQLYLKSACESHPVDTCLKLVSTIFYQIYFFHQMIALQKQWKMFFVSSKKLFSFLRYSDFCSPCQPLL